ncbi:MAG: hypothetical protein A2V46_07525 [Bacteroidetes bacterium RBG_19FT_COMBO_42_7]|nr:MAG: hypothetical protein A2Y71_09185 [Bacteroidetes bacterium RBG_13_42_15]OFY77339.1 MAG: hypothetical protein A2V46_07525 [Bacteroidetes bacterium RBG_19FT_COMBO_42_7]
MKTRPILLGIITLIIGFVIGMLTSAQLRLHRLQPVRMYFSQERFREGFYKIIQPDEEQKAKIDQILDKYAKMNSETQGNFRKELDANVRAMRKELDSNLTKEQLVRLKEMDERRQEMMRQERERHKNDTTNFRNGRRRPPEGSGERRPEFQGSPPPPFPERDTSWSPDRE